MKKLLISMYLASALVISFAIAPQRPLAVNAKDDKPEAKKADDKGRGYVAPTPAVRAKLHAEAVERHGYRMYALAKNATPPAKFDCVEMGWVPAVDDQGSCGSCYLVATIRQLTCAYIKAGYAKADGSFRMSDQYGMDRPRDFGGCDGGNGTEVIAWAQRNSWVAEKYLDPSLKPIKDYPPYEARTGTDRTAPNAKKWAVADWGFVTGDQSNRAATTLEIKTALMNYGVLNIALDAGGQFGSYRSGIITALGRNINHEIVLTGWDDAKGAFRINNQWSTDWGEAGYAWLSYGAANNLVDVFWVSVVALPPPPPPPVPPIPPLPPGPFGTPTMTLNGTGTAFDGIPYELTKPGTAATVSQIREMLNTLSPPTVLSPKPEDAKKEDDWRKKQEQFNQQILDALKALKPKEE